MCTLRPASATRHEPSSASLRLPPVPPACCGRTLTCRIGDSESPPSHPDLCLAFKWGHRHGEGGKPRPGLRACGRRRRDLLRDEWQEHTSCLGYVEANGNYAFSPAWTLIDPRCRLSRRAGSQHGLRHLVPPHLRHGPRAKRDFQPCVSAGCLGPEFGRPLWPPRH